MTKNYSIDSYMNYTNPNYGLNSVVVSIGKHDFYFSYKTLIAFFDGKQLIVSENILGSTTGKHLKKIESDKRKWVHREVFLAKYAQFLEENNLEVKSSLPTFHFPPDQTDQAPPKPLPSEQPTPDQPHPFPLERPKITPEIGFVQIGGIKLRDEK